MIFLFWWLILTLLTADPVAAFLLALIVSGLAWLADGLMQGICKHPVKSLLMLVGIGFLLGSGEDGEC